MRFAEGGTAGQVGFRQMHPVRGDIAGKSFVLANQQPNVRQITFSPEAQPDFTGIRTGKGAIDDGRPCGQVWDGPPRRRRAFGIGKEQQRRQFAKARADFGTATR